MNTMSTRANNKENHFYRLPDELTVSIFNKIADLKCLCQCSLVSKHFAAVIRLVQTVSVTVPDSGSYDIECVKRINRFAIELQGSTIENIHTLLDSYSLQHLKLPMFLHKFNEIKFICLSYESPESNTNSSFLTRKMMLARNSVKMERFLALVPRSVHKDDEDEPDHAQASNDREGKPMECFLRFLGRYGEWLCFILILVKCHSSLHGVTINDSHGKLVIVDETFCNIRLQVLQELRNHLCVNTIIRYVRLPVLHLPSSGYVLRDVSLMIMDPQEHSHACDTKKWDEIRFWDSDDELFVLREAVKEILKNHRGDIQIFHT